MNRRDFLRMGAGSAMLAAAGCVSRPESASEAITKGKFACKYVDDCIWFLRDIARMKPKSIFDTPFLGAFKKIHDATGLKIQFNLFYRTDFFYGMDEFTLADMPADYRSEFQANADWIKFGMHSLQEFPDYPWISADYDDVAKCLKMIRGEVDRFAGDNMFARFLIPHWVPMSKPGQNELIAGNRFLNVEHPVAVDNKENTEGVGEDILLPPPARIENNAELPEPGPKWHGRQIVRGDKIYLGIRQGEEYCWMEMQGKVLPGQGA